MLLSLVGYADSLMIPQVKYEGPEGIAVEVTLSDKDQIPMNEIHSWQLKITKNDAPINGGQFKITGGMDAHGHALPTKPKVIEKSNGTYQIKGLKFQMPGLWFVELNGDWQGNALFFRFEFEVYP